MFTPFQMKEGIQIQISFLQKTAGSANFLPFNPPSQQPAALEGGESLFEYFLYFVVKKVSQNFTSSEHHETSS